MDITHLTLSATWSRSLGEASSTLDLECKHITDYHAMDAITLTIDGVLCFQGIIKSQSDTYDETVKRVSFQCVDITDKLYHIIVAESFVNQTAKQIIQQLRDLYEPTLDVSGVEDVGGPIEQIDFNYEPLADCINKLAETLGAYWTIDADYRVRFFQERGRDIADFYPVHVLEGSFSLDYSAVELANRVWVIGSKQASGNTVTQTFLGDGANQYFAFVYTPNYPVIKENGVNQSIALFKDQAPTTKYLYNKTERVLKRVDGPLPAGVTLTVDYKPTVQIIDYFEDSASVARYGRYERVIRDKKITDKMAARKRGRSELKRVRDVIRYAKWSTRVWQVRPGDISRLLMPAFGIDSFWRINGIEISFSPEDVIATIDAEEVQ